MVVIKSRFLLLGGMLKIFISYGHDTESCSSILLYGLLFTLSTCDHVKNFSKYMVSDSRKQVLCFTVSLSNTLGARRPSGCAWMAH